MGGFGLYVSLTEAKITEVVTNLCINRSLGMDKIYPEFLPVLAVAQLSCLTHHHADVRERAAGLADCGGGSSFK